MASVNCGTCLSARACRRDENMKCITISCRGYVKRLRNEEAGESVCEGEIYVLMGCLPAFLLFVSCACLLLVFIL